LDPAAGSVVVVFCPAEGVYGPHRAGPAREAAMSSGYPIDPELAAALEGAMTISASPGTIEDHTRPDIGPVAMLTATPSVSVHTSDDHAGAEVVDLVASSLLRWGFALVTAIEPAELAAPAAARLARAARPHRSSAADSRARRGVLRRDLGETTPPGWQQTLRRRGRLVVLVGSTLALDRGDRYGQLTAASRAGEIVGAQLPLT
jgi:hypothetical protein